MIKLIFFDWNGTILDDISEANMAQAHVFGLFDIKPITLEQHREFSDIPITKFYAKAGIDERTFNENRTLIQETFHGFYEKYSERCEARAGAMELLKWLRSKGIRSVILSNHTVESIERHLKRLGLAVYFDAVLANDNIMATGIHDKAERAKDYLEKSGLDPKQILVVGDAPEEAKIARQLGAKSALLEDGWYSEGRLKEAKPDFIVSRPDNLITIIENA